MQEDVENKVAQLVITTTKLSLRVILLAMKKFIQYQKSLKAKKTSKKAVGIKGKQSVKALIGQNQGVSNIEIAETNIKDFDRIARKYGVDFAIKKDRTVVPPKYLIFFKARDADALTAAFGEYTAKTVKRAKKPSVLLQLAKFKDLIASLPKKVRNKEREQSL